MPASRSDLRPFRRIVLALAGALAIAGAPAEAKVYHARDEALRLAFPDAERIETRDVVLTPEQHRRIEERAKAPLESDLVTLYVGWKDGSPSAYALFDTHTVRTFPETFLVVISPDGKVAATHILAFHEPEEYLPSARWLQTFRGKSATDDLRVGSGVVAVTGSTLSTNAVAAGIRRALAIFDAVVGGK